MADKELVNGLASLQKSVEKLAETTEKNTVETEKTTEERKKKEPLDARINAVSTANQMIGSALPPGFSTFAGKTAGAIAAGGIAGGAVSIAGSAIQKASELGWQAFSRGFERTESALSRAENFSVNVASQFRKAGEVLTNEEVARLFQVSLRGGMIENDVRNHVRELVQAGTSGLKFVRSLTGFDLTGLERKLERGGQGIGEDIDIEAEKMRRKMNTKANMHIKNNQNFNGE